MSVCVCVDCVFLQATVRQAAVVTDEPSRGYILYLRKGRRGGVREGELTGLAEKATLWGGLEGDKKTLTQPISA